MIDTIKLTFTEFRVTRPDLFYNQFSKTLPLIDTLHGKSNCYYSIPSDFKYCEYFLKSYFRYYPYRYAPHSVTVKDIPTKKFRFLLQIEVSLPYLIVGHNALDIHDYDFLKAVSAIKDLLFQCGIEILEESIINCSWISRIDYCKNILVQNVSAKEFIKLLKKCSKGSRYENDDNYQTSAIFNNNQQRLIVYDKPQELIDKHLYSLKGQSKGSKAYEVASIFAAIKKIKPLEIVRVEHRLKTTQAIKRELEPVVGHKYPFTFKEVFSTKVAQTVLLKHWTKVTSEEKIKTLILGEKQIHQIINLLESIKKQGLIRKINLSSVLYIKLTDELGEEGSNKKIRSVKSPFSLTSYRKSAFQSSSKLDIYDPRLEAYSVITNCLREYQPIQISAIPS